MTAAKFGARACAAAFVLGIALSPHVAGVAAAEVPDTDPAPVTAADPAGPPRSSDRPGRAHRKPGPAARSRTADSDTVPAIPRVRSANSRAAAGAALPVPVSDSPAPKPASSNRVVPPAVPRTSAATRAAAQSAEVAPAVAAPSALTAPGVAEVSVAPSGDPRPTAATGAPSLGAPDRGCAACWGAEAPTLGQAINTVINHLFNSTFDWLSTLPGNGITNLIEGALVLARRSLFLSPEGVTASQVGTSLEVTVNTGSVAYFRQEGTSLQVSGDPSFRRAQTFDAATVELVAVANGPGNAGCAGVVVESGILNGTLTTSEIDALRFGSDAAVSDSVKSSVSGGPLVLRDAVRGLGGVEFQAPVVLANNVEINAGTGGATFAGPVDAARAGEQSLTVTALGDTVFGAAVGGNAALASLLTRGIAPVSVRQSNDTRTVPLHFLPQYAPNGQAEVKYGIDVAIGDNPSQVYEFDTGGNAFFAGYNPSLWKGVPLTSYGVSDTYSSGNYYDGVLANARITIGKGDQRVSTEQPIGLTAILAGGNSNSGEVFDFTNPLVPPVESHFFGDFGAAFGTVAVTGVDTPLTSVLFQLPGNLSSGFLVQLGPIGIDPQLTVGVTDELRAQFPYAVPVAALTGGGSYPVSGYQVLQQFGFAPQYFAQKDGGDEKPIGKVSACAGAVCLPSLIDSGAPSTGIRLKGQGGAQFDDGGQLEPGVDFIAEFPTTQGRPPLRWTFVAGNNGSVDLVNYQDGSVASDTQNVNTGLNLYNYYDVMFDVQKQVIWLRPTGGQSTVSAVSVTTTGEQNYRQNATLSGTYNTGGGKFTVAGVTALTAATTVNAGAGDVTFSGTVDGPFALTVNSSGATVFARQVGGQDPLASLTSDAGGSTATASVITGGSQNYGDPLSMNGRYLLSLGSFTAAGQTQLDGPVTVTLLEPGADATFAGDIDGQEGRGYSLTVTAASGGDVSLNGDVGGTHPLGGLAVLSGPFPFEPVTFSAGGRIILDGSLGFAAQNGLSLGNQVSANLTQGGQVRNFIRSGDSSGNGVTLTQPGQTTLQNFVISNNQSAGIVVVGATDLALEGNSVIANARGGIEISDSVNVTVTGSSITGNGVDGIQVIDSETVQISGNTISGNAESGILSQSTAVQISGNSLSTNAVAGVTVDQRGLGNEILDNSIYANGATNGLGIRLVNGGNGGQPAPLIDSLALTGNTLTVNVSVKKVDGYSGRFTTQVFYTPPGAATAPQGQTLIYSQAGVEAGDRTLVFPVTGLADGGIITVTATPETGQPNTSEFSNGKVYPPAD